VKSVAEFVRCGRTALPHGSLPSVAAIFFSLSVLSLVISLSAAQLFLAGSGVVYATYLVRNRPRFWFPPIALPIIFFSAFTVLSVLEATNSAVGWFAVRKLVLFVVVLLAANLVVKGEHLLALLKGLFICSGLAALVAIIQFAIQFREVAAAHPDRIYYYMTLERIRGFMGHWMNFGGQQMLIFAMLLAFLLIRAGAAGDLEPAPSLVASDSDPASGGVESERSAARRADPRALAAWFWRLVLMTVAISIVLNFTRGVWLGCFIAVVYLVARWRARLLCVLPVLLVVGYLFAPALVRERVQRALHPRQDPALSIRLEMWQVALGMIRAHPWLGVGPNNIEQAYTLYLPRGKSPEVGFHGHFHNNILQLGAERGLPCLAAWFWLMGALGWHCWRIRRHLIRWRWVAEGALAAWLAFLAEGLFEFNFGASPVLMLFLFVIATPFIAEHMERRW